MKMTVKFSPRAPVRRLHVVGLEIPVGEHRAPDRRDEDGPVLQAEFVNRLCDHAVDDAVAAAGAVVEWSIVQRLGSLEYLLHLFPHIRCLTAATTSAGVGTFPPDRP